MRELYETVPNCIARVVSSITDVDRMYELYKTSDKPVFMVLSKESARGGYLRKPTVMWNKRRKGFICPVCGAVQEMTVTTDGISYTVPADSIFFHEENNKNHKCQSYGEIIVGYFASRLFIANHFFLNYICYTVFEDCQSWFHRLSTKELYDQYVMSQMDLMLGKHHRHGT